MKINQTIKFLFLPTAILAYLSIIIAPLASHPVEKWSRDYTCGQYDITVSEEPHGVFNYQSRSAKGNLNLKGGTIKHTKKQTLFQFHNNDFEYLIWTNLEDRSGVLEVYQNKRKILKQNCLLSAATPISLNSKYLQYPMHGIVVEGASDRTYSLLLEFGEEIYIYVYSLGANASVSLSDSNKEIVTFRGSDNINPDSPKCYEYDGIHPDNKYFISATGGANNNFYSFLIAVGRQGYCPL